MDHDSVYPRAMKQIADRFRLLPSAHDEIDRARTKKKVTWRQILKTQSNQRAYSRMKALSGPGVTEATARRVFQSLDVALGLSVSFEAVMGRVNAHSVELTMNTPTHVWRHESLVFGTTTARGGGELTVWVRPEDGTGTWYRDLHEVHLAADGTYGCRVRLGNQGGIGMHARLPLDFTVRVVWAPLAGRLGSEPLSDADLARTMAELGATFRERVVTREKDEVPSPILELATEADVGVTWHGEPGRLWFEVYRDGRSVREGLVTRGELLDLPDGLYEVKLGRSRGDRTRRTFWLRRTERESRASEARRRPRRAPKKGRKP